MEPEREEREGAEEISRKPREARTEEPQSRGGNPTPRSQPPKPTIPMTVQKFPNTPQPEEPKKSTCGPLYYDLLLIASWDRELLQLLNDV